MVSSGTDQQPSKPSEGVLFLLQRSGLMANFQYGRASVVQLSILTTEMCRGVLRITSAGFQFLLHSPHDQLWDLLLQYLHLAEVRF